MLVSYLCIHCIYFIFLKVCIVLIFFLSAFVVDFEVLQYDAVYTSSFEMLTTNFALETSSSLVSVYWQSCCQLC